MSRRHTLERQRDSLLEIRGIMNSMKTLAYMETRKLARFLGAQQAAVQTIEHAAADFLTHYPDTLPEGGSAVHIGLLIGTERGFCGEFNQRLLRFLDHASVPAGLQLIVVGHKLRVLLESDPRVVAGHDGASVAEEVSAVLQQVVRTLTALQQAHPLLNLHVIAHADEDAILMTQLLPAFRSHAGQAPPHGYPPLLYLAPRDFLLALAGEYLFAVLHERLYTSMMVENRNRVSHLDGAVKHLDDNTSDLSRRCSALRQEEIIEEIEIILLNAEAAATDPLPGRQQRPDALR